MVGTDIRNKDLQGVLWNWKPIAALLPGRCGASDIDGVIERRGHFLFLEGKREGEKLSLGQLIMLKALAALDPEKVTVLVITGDRETGEITEYRQVKASGLGDAKAGRDFHKSLKRWWKNVSGD